MEKEQEKREADVLLNRGYKFKIQYTVRPTGIKKIFGISPKIENRIFEIKQPTLAVLDLVSSRFLTLKITETDKSADVDTHIHAATQTAAENAKTMSEIIAIFALGEECFNFDGRTYLYDEKKVKKLANLIFHNVKPSEMKNIISAATALANLPDFLLSIRLTGASRTTIAANLVG